MLPAVLLPSSGLSLQLDLLDTVVMLLIAVFQRRALAFSGASSANASDLRASGQPASSRSSSVAVFTQRCYRLWRCLLFFGGENALLLSVFTVSVMNASVIGVCYFFLASASACR